MASWDLAVTVEDLGSDAPAVTLSVASDLHVGGVILKLVEKTRGSLSVSLTLTHRLNILPQLVFQKQCIGNTLT